MPVRPEIRSFASRMEAATPKVSQAYEDGVEPDSIKTAYDRLDLELISLEDAVQENDYHRLMRASAEFALHAMRLYQLAERRVVALPAVKFKPKSNRRKAKYQ